MLRQWHFDVQAVTDVVKYKLSFAEIEQGRPATVKDAAMAFKEICYEYRLVGQWPATVKDAAMAFKEICYEYRQSV
jgi:hypothetical protein